MKTSQETVRSKFKAVDIQLVTLRDDLYSGSWDKMVTDLQDRLNHRPYIYKIGERIHEDLLRIKTLRVLEEELGSEFAVMISLVEAES